MKIHPARLWAIVLVSSLLPACGTGGGGTLTPTVAPEAPTGLAVRSGNGRIALTWVASPAAAVYNVLRSRTSGGPYSPVAQGAGVTSTILIDTTPVNSTTYFYVVTAQNAFGQSQPSTEIMAVPGFSGTSISAGFYFSLAVLEDGTAWGWGTNSDQELGTGTSAAISNTALQVAGGNDFRVVAAGLSWSLGLKSDGSVWAWGSNLSGQLGNGTTGGTSNVPLQISNLTGITALACGGVAGPSFRIGHNLALRSDGTVWAWGDNASGQLGNGTTGGVGNLPVQVSGLAGVTAIAAGCNFSLAARSDGTVWAWGSNSNFSLGTSNSSQISNVPVQVPNLTGVVAISSSGFSFLSLALQFDGSVWTWGGSGYLPVQMPNLSAITCPPRRNLCLS
jgi:alpha-tubulin suppressor-like RCC1 family protein